MLENVVIWLNDEVGWDALTDAAAAVYLALPDDWVVVCVVAGVVAVMMARD